MLIDIEIMENENDDCTRIILDNGTSSIKAGIKGEDKPSVVISK